VAQALVEWAEFQKDMLGNQQSASVDHAPEEGQHGRTQDLVARQFHNGDGTAVRIDQVEVREEDCIAPTQAGQVIDLRPGLVLQVQIIVAQPSKIFACHVGDGSVQRATDASILLGDITDPIVVVACDALSLAAVGRAIIDDDDLDVIISLRKSALERQTKVAPAIVHRHRNGHSG